MKTNSIILIALLALASCNNSENKQNKTTMPVKPSDVHSFAHPDEVVVKDLDLDINVDFKTKTIHGKASYKIENKTGADTIYLDTKDMDIEKVTEGAK
jgi:leukotriene-A4 hydrolase